MDSLLIGLLGGLITGISPCVLPILPVIFLTAGASGGAGAAPEAIAARRSRPYWVIGGLITSFAVLTLFGSFVLSLLPIPQDAFRWIGIAVLAVIGVGLLIPAVQHVIEKPFQRLPQASVRNGGSGFGVGLALGTVFVPCAGPVLAAIVVAGATGDIGVDTLLLTAAFAVGVAVPLLVFALAGSKVGERVRGYRRRERGIRIAAGVATLGLAVGLAFNVPQFLQTLVPDYTAGVQEAIVGDREPVAPADGSLRDCPPGSPQLESCGVAPEITGITRWLNTPGDASLDLDGLRGQVVLVDFWTFDCINCRRALPHVEAWDAAYRDAGLTVIGVHTPEYPFEREVRNVQAAAKDLGVEYPIAIDNDYATWNSFQNQYWPAAYLIDAAGNVRHVTFGEGAYDETEELIRDLLEDADPQVQLPARTDVPDLTPSFW